MQFLSKAKLQFEYRDQDGIRWWSLKKNLILYIGKDKLDFKKTNTVNKSDLIIVPKETFLSDLASVPKALHFIYKPNGKYTRASLIHDYMYSQRDLKRGYCDKVFRDCMKIDNVKFFTRWLFWCCVRLAGESHKA